MGKYHDILGVSEGATPNQIRSAHRKLSRTHHPDVGGSEEKMKQLNEAKEGLLAGRSGPKGSTSNFEKPGHMSDQFKDFFSGGTQESSGYMGADNPFRNGGFDPSHAPDDNLGGYSFAQHTREARMEGEDDMRQAEKDQKTKKSLAGGWTPERAAHVKCSWCGDSMENTEPHEVHNESKTPSGKTLVGMHDECHEEAQKEDPNNCEVCGGALRTKAEKEFAGVHNECFDERYGEF
jgi:DnaJ-class molecular chaperone